MSALLQNIFLKILPEIILILKDDNNMKENKV